MRLFNAFRAFSFIVLAFVLSSFFGDNFAVARENVKNPPHLLFPEIQDKPLNKNQPDIILGYQVDVFDAAQKSVQLDARFHLKIEEFSAKAYFDFPIMVAPGTNSLAPKLTLRIGRTEISDPKLQAPYLSGSEAIRKCDDLVGFCLAGEMLLAVPDKIGRYYFKADPAISIEKTATSFILKDSQGLEKRYDELSSNVWSLVQVHDWFENWITYEYGLNGRRLEAVTYGQANAKNANTRRLHIQYSRRRDVRPVQIVSAIGTEIIRAYRISYNKDNLATGFQECAPSPAIKGALNCYAPYSLAYQQERLSSISNGKDSTTFIRYGKLSEEGLALVIQTIDAAKIEVESLVLSYKAPVAIRGMVKGFARLAKMTGKSQFVASTEFYDKSVLGRKTAEKLIHQKDKGAEVLSSKSYYYTDISVGGADYSVLEKMETVFETDKDTDVNSVETIYRYDKSGRVHEIKTHSSTEFLKYLDETDHKLVDTTAGNLLVSRSKKSPVTKSNTQKWNYVLKNGRPYEVTFQQFQNGKLDPSTTAFTRLDAYGNQIHIQKNGLKTDISYEKKFQTFPNIFMLAFKGQKSQVTTEYDPATGIQTSEKFSDGSQTLVTLDAMGRPKTTQITIRDPKSSKASISPELSTYTQISWVQTSKGGYQQAKTTRHKNLITDQKWTTRSEKEVDAVGRIIGMTGLRTDGSGKILKQSRLSQYFSNDGRTIEVFTGDGDRQETQFNQKGQLIREATEKYGERTFEYGKKGRVSRVISGGAQIDLEYDDQGRLVRKILPDGKETHFQYDGVFVDKPETVALPDGKSIRFAYNDKGQVINKTVRLPFGNKGVHEFSITRTYKNDRIATVTYPGGAELAYGYENGRLTKLEWITKPSPDFKDSASIVARYSAHIEDGGAKELSKIFGNEVEETYRWDANGALTDINFAKGATVGSSLNDLIKLSYDIDPATKLIRSETREDKYSGGVVGEERIYQYDDDRRISDAIQNFKDKNGQIVSSKLDVAGLPPKILNPIAQDLFGNIIQSASATGQLFTHSFDVENKLVGSKSANGKNSAALTYDYDHVGQRLTKTIIEGQQTFYLSPFYQITIDENDQVFERFYILDHMGRVAVLTQKMTKERLGAFAVAGMSTANGSDDIPEFTWAAFTATDMASPSVQLTMILLFVSCGLALFYRFSEPARKHSINVTPAPFSWPRQVTTAAVLAVFGLQLGAMPVRAVISASEAIIETTGTVYFHHDVRGSVIATSDEEGKVRSVNSYEPYGALQNTSLTHGENQSSYKFAGHEFDVETGLYYMGARYYDPKEKRFLSHDPGRQTVNPFSYTQNDPVNRTDPDGRMDNDLAIAFIEENQDRDDREDDGRPAEDQPEGLIIDIAPDSSNAALEYSASEPLAVQIDDGGDGVERADSWVRYPTFWNLSFGTQDGLEPPEEAAEIPDYTREDEAEYNRLARSGYMQGWSRFGGVLQGSLSAFVLAAAFPSSYTYADGTVSEAGYGRDLANYSVMLLTFLGYGYGYSANESEYWRGVTQVEAGVGDYARLALRRIFWKASFQVVAFTGLNLWGRMVDGYPIFGEDDPSFGSVMSVIALLMLQYLPYSLMGAIAILPFFMMILAPSPTFDEDMTERRLQSYPWWQRFAITTSISYRDFLFRRGFWERDAAAYSRDAALQSLWYPAYVLHLYAWFLFGSLGYYSGLSMSVSYLPHLDWNYFFNAWRRNITLLAFCPPGSPLTVINYWHRRSLTLIPRQSAGNPRRSGLLFRILGPTEGLRIARFDDSSYLPTDEWLAQLRTHRQSLLIEEIEDDDRVGIEMDAVEAEPSRGSDADLEPSSMSGEEPEPFQDLEEEQKVNQKPE
jgi:RHS repeat-associated protein